MQAGKKPKMIIDSQNIFDLKVLIYATILLLQKDYSKMVAAYTVFLWTGYM